MSIRSLMTAVSLARPDKPLMRPCVITWLREPDIAWLRESLQAAIQLEFATIPPYLCGMWSIIKHAAEPAPVYGRIKSIVFQEMLHMGLACNLLTTTGSASEPKSTPRINKDTSLPKYPGPLPGDVRPELTVVLAGLSMQLVKKVYMEIEYPQCGPIAVYSGQIYPTIGAFYDAVVDAFEKLEAKAKKTGKTIITGKRQLSLNSEDVPLFEISNLKDVKNAIKLIKDQGEGTPQDPHQGGAGSGFAHYYKFGEIYYQRELVQKDGQWKYEGKDVPFPGTYPVAEVPSGGYTGHGVSDKARKLLDEFNKQYTATLDAMQGAWEKGGEEGQKLLDNATIMMDNLANPAQELMKIPLAAGGGNYGPDFRLAR